MIADVGADAGAKERAPADPSAAPSEGDSPRHPGAERDGRGSGGAEEAPEAGLPRTGLREGGGPASPDEDRGDALDRPVAVVGATARSTDRGDAEGAPTDRPAEDPPAEDPEVVRLRSARVYAVFERIMARQMARAFHAVRLARPGVPDLPADRPLVVVSNHPSWWDPPFAMRLVREIGRESYGPIEAAQLERYRFMRRLGLWGVEPGTRAGAAAFLRVGEAVLADPARMVWITGQGTFSDPRTRPVVLRPGTARLLARVPRAVALPVALEYPFWTESRPEALARFGRPLEGPATAAEWQGRLEAGLADAMDALARDAQRRDPAAFTDLARGRAGVGGVYDLWRRARAALRRERFEAGHMSDGGAARSPGAESGLREGAGGDDTRDGADRAPDPAEGARAARARAADHGADAPAGRADRAVGHGRGAGPAPDGKPNEKAGRA